MFLLIFGWGATCTSAEYRGKKGCAWYWGSRRVQELTKCSHEKSPSTIDKLTGKILAKRVVKTFKIPPRLQNQLCPMPPKTKYISSSFLPPDPLAVLLSPSVRQTSASLRLPTWDPWAWNCATRCWAEIFRGLGDLRMGQVGWWKFLESLRPSQEWFREAWKIDKI